MEKVRQNPLLYTLLFVFIFTATVWYFVLANEREQVLTVAFLDVGQGDAIFIEAPNGNQILIDGGKNRSVLRALSHVMPFYDRSIDVVIATHPDEDHIGGLPDVLKRFKVDLYLDPGVTHDTNAYKETLRLVQTRNIEYVLARRGMKIDLGGGVSLEILFPDRDVSGLESNAASVITRLVYGETEFLFTGDSPKAIEKYLTSIDGKKLQSDVLKVGHHGSKTSSADAFLAAVLPSFAVISAGADNRYGHPHEEVITALKDLDAKIVSTSESGTIIFISDGMTLQKK